MACRYDPTRKVVPVSLARSHQRKAPKRGGKLGFGPRWGGGEREEDEMLQDDRKSPPVALSLSPYHGHGLQETNPSAPLAYEICSAAENELD
ncbi:uncharacterized protein CTHT_0062010 [Thermochaetoides thermophila DSM 1495]|uniref:Uncharacterized protein n=1 Tax=Chaetomium thermophilum (strain DSM 1495 / CBS 144.50 / IMI 039719) TaxID=759272 RepID=G0SE09_CHATD|nr:hypothetical protein CTHT_0062010 [Thermochaetoides thermophila DSM 1495]EGS18186.1 hypothetical protein CTHT_0062010 [Thermochaetoides thermophila DSM 1495]